jgi:SAM-dependent methyltransferase
MAQNIYDQLEFFAGYSRLGRSVEGLAGAAEWPALRAMLPVMTGLRVVDLGCGFGWFCRWAAQQGAVDIVGLDLSERMLRRAEELSTGCAIRYRRADLDGLELPVAGFDLAYSSLAFHYVEDAGRLFATIHRSLVPGGTLVFSTEHPVFMAPTRPGWTVDAHGRATWPVDAYFAEGSRTTDWLAPGVVKYHRTLGTTLNLLLAAGFSIRRVEEFCPGAEQIAARPELARECERPMFLLVAAGA